ncbi:uncharacterized protein DFL_003769 [Arthrobotrys flagrans]|uniref:Peptidase S8/S53 domain-containing protein n=1 Tax=Arthrobotrys flagrans TaxID=97331 RepID=A0A437A2S4_ARTFL|nr:hypothetical protein DFL_003769 [Arthrobotrys flagrans]
MFRFTVLLWLLFAHTVTIYSEGTSQEAILRVFAIRKGHEKDKELDEVRKYVKTTVGSNEEETEERWALDHHGGVMWFYLKTTESIAKEIMEKWSTMIETSSILNFEDDAMEDQAVDITDDDIPETNPGAQGIRYSGDIHFNNLTKRALETKQDVRENCMLSQLPTYETPDPCLYFTDSKQGEGVMVYVVDNDFKHIKWGKSKDHVFIDPLDGLPSWIGFANHEIPPYDTVPANCYYRHGTAVLSKLLGAKYGVAKNVKPILVKVSDRNCRRSLLFRIEAYEKIIVDIRHKTLIFESQSLKAPNFIVLTTYSIPNNMFNRNKVELGDALDRHSQAIQTLTNMRNVAYIAVAGNGPSGGNQWTMHEVC